MTYVLFIAVNLLLLLVLLHVKHAVVGTCLAKTVLTLRTVTSAVVVIGTGLIVAANSFMINISSLH